MGILPHATNAVLLQNNDLHFVFSRVLPCACWYASNRDGARRQWGPLIQVKPVPRRMP